MQPSEVELWAIHVADRIKAGQQVEDSRVEVKREWPKPDHDLARQLAGLANAARLEPVLLVIGLDPRTNEVMSAAKQELATWWPQLEKCFNGIAPALLHDLAVPRGEAILHALLFETTRAPFVVTLPNGSRFDREVPWREGTRTRSATREDLLRILVPAARTPKIEVMKASLEWLPANPSRPQSIDGQERLLLNMALYITPRATAPVVLPHHRCRGAIRWKSGQADISTFSFINASTTITTTSSEACLTLPGSVHLVGIAPVALGRAPDADAAFEFALTITTSDENAIPIQGRFAPRETSTISGVDGRHVRQIGWKLDEVTVA